MTSEMSSVIELAVAEPPRSLNNFQARFVPTSVELGSCDAATFDLSCRDCTGNLFQVLEMSATLGPAGVVARCAKCGREGEVFNATTDGYDGAYGHLNFLKEDLDVKPLAGESGAQLGTVQLRARYSYSIEMSELVEHAQELRVGPQDLFDWFHILTRAGADDAWVETWDFECA